MRDASPEPGAAAAETRESERSAAVAGAPNEPMAAASPSVTAPQPVVPVIPASAVSPEPEPEPGTEPGSRPELEQLELEARRQWTILREHARAPSPPPAGRALDELVWGLAQPFLGLRLLLGHGDLFVRGLIPVLALLAICALIVDPAEGAWELVAGYYGVLVGAASISPILFCRNYAKLAAEARRHLEVPRHEPYLRSYGQAIAEALAQAIVLGVGVAPWAALLTSLPLLGATWIGGIWAALLGWVWVLHWIVVEALDSARTLPPGEDPQTLEQRHAQLDPPWYSGALLARLRAPLPTLLLPVRWWGGLLAWLGRRWRGEVALIELRPFLALGFGLGASLLLLIPGLNLLLRPALVIGASHVLGRLEPELDARLPDEDPNADEAGPEPGATAQLDAQLDAQPGADAAALAGAPTPAALPAAAADEPVEA